MNSEKWPVKWAAKDGEPLEANEHGLLEVNGAATGFMRIRRSVIEKLSEAYPHLLVQDPRAPGGQYYALFSNTIANGKVTGEDYTSAIFGWRLGTRSGLIQIFHSNIWA